MRKIEPSDLLGPSLAKCDTIKENTCSDSISRLFRGQRPRFAGDFRKIRAALSFESTSMVLSLDQIFGKVTFQKKLKWMTFKELQEVEADSGQDGVG